MNTKVDLPVSIQERIAKLVSDRDQIQKKERDLERQHKKVRSQIQDISDKIYELSNPFQQGDVVEDEMGVRYRITTARSGYGGPTGLVGIRLNKQGVESYQNPRPIRSPHLTKVSPRGRNEE